MALRLAGEEFSVVRGLDDGGWLRQINANDTLSGLKVTQQGNAPILELLSAQEQGIVIDKLYASANKRKWRIYPAEDATDVDLVISSIDNAGAVVKTPIRLDHETGRVTLGNGADFIDLLATLKNTGAANSGRVMIDDALDLNWNDLFQVKGVPIQAVKQVVYSDASPVTIVTLPANSEVIDVKVQIFTQFGGANPSLDIGDDADPDGLLPSASIDETAPGWYGDEADVKGVYLWDSVNKHSIRKTYTAQTDLKCTIGGSGLDMGIANVYLTYRRLA